MGHIEDMNVDFQESRQYAAVHAVRGHMTQARDDLQTHLDTVDAEIAKGEFDLVTADIRAEGLAVRTIMVQALAALNAHTDFIDWVQPE